MKKTITVLVLIYSMVLLSACPQKSIGEAKRQSSQIAVYANNGVEITRELFRNQIISLAQKDRIADGFILLAKSGQTFDLAVKNIENTYGTRPPKSEIERLFKIFNAELVAKFLDILRELKVISADNRIGEVIALLQTAILIIAKVFGNKRQVELQIEQI